MVLSRELEKFLASMEAPWDADDPWREATFSNVAPVLTVVWGVLFFHEVLSPALVVGGLLTLGGVIWTSRPAPSSARAASLAGEGSAACPID